MSDPKPGCSPNLQVPQTLLLAGVSLCCRHIVVMIIVKIIIYEYLSFIIIIIHCYSLLWAEMLLQTQRSTSHPCVLPAQSHKTGQGQGQRPIPAPAEASKLWVLLPATCPQKLGRSPEREACPLSATCPTGQPRCGRHCPHSGVRSTRCSSSPDSTASPSMSWTRMHSGRAWGLGLGTRLVALAPCVLSPGVDNPHLGPGLWDTLGEGNSRGHWCALWGQTQRGGCRPGSPQSRGSAAWAPIPHRVLLPTFVFQP